MFFRHRLARWGSVVGIGCCTGYTLDHLFYDSTFTRNLRTLYYGALVTIDYKWNFTRAKADQIEQLHSRVAERIAYVCRKNGGLYIKFGQQIASLNHVLPPQYAAIFSTFFDEAPTIDYNQVESILESEFHTHPSNVFQEFHPIPMASASIAQVHKAKTKQGEWVAVKVQKPQIQKQMHWDLATFRCVSWLIEKLFDLPISWSADFVSERFKSEVNFINEGKNAEEAKRRIQESAYLNQYCHIPLIDWSLTSERVLTMEWIDGTKFNLQALKSQHYDLQHIMHVIVHLFSDQIFRTGFVHCDPHQGNILVRPHPTTGRPQVCLLDHGLYVSSTPRFRHDYALFWKSLFTQDIPLLTKITQGWGMSDVQMFATSTLQKPWSASKSPHLQHKLDLKEIYHFQLDGKKRIQEFFHDTELMPRELIFIGRNLNIVRQVRQQHANNRSNNKLLQSPVNRVNLMADYAVSCLGHDWQVWSNEQTSTAPSLWKQTVFIINSRLNYLKFKTILLLSSIDFYVAKYRHQLEYWLFGSNVYGHEQVLEERLKSKLFQEFGIMVDENAFDA